MSHHQVLARKWRPQTFDQVIGQQHVIAALSHAITENRLHHAYLFTGTRGIGKTTFARIIARCLNCEQGPTPTPCGKCHACQTIPTGQFVDLIEIDAASRTKVEDTRELLETVHYAPSYGRYKIYLIDEVHMFSNHSFNALLKTLEEPPEHVIFILATTDPQKLPMTVLSRCLQFRLKALTLDEIKTYLHRILNEENIAFEAQALDMLAQSAQGSMRDALSALDQAIALGQGCVKSAAIASLIGSAPTEQLHTLITAILGQDLHQTLNTFNDLKALGVSAEELLKQISTTWCQLFKDVLLPPQEATITIEASHPWHQNSKSERLSRLQLLYQMTLLAQKDMIWAPDAFLHLEMLLLRMLSFKPTTAQSTPTPQSQTTSDCTTPPTHTTTALNTQTWNALLPTLNLSGMSKALARGCQFGELNGETLVLHTSPSEASLINDKTLKRIEEALKEAGYHNQVIIKAQQDLKKNAAPSSQQSTKVAKLKETLGATVVRQTSTDST